MRSFTTWGTRAPRRPPSGSTTGCRPRRRSGRVSPCPRPRPAAPPPAPPPGRGGPAPVSTVWTATPPGSHDVCVVVDPDNVVPESNETNNTACVTASVLPPETRPDYVPVSPLPTATTRAGLSPPIPLSVAGFNQGNA